MLSQNTRCKVLNWTEFGIVWKQISIGKKNTKTKQNLTFSQLNNGYSFKCCYSMKLYGKIPEEKHYLMHRVHCIHLVMIVFTRGPMFLSSTARFPSRNRLLSLPNIMDWSLSRLWNSQSNVIMKLKWVHQKDLQNYSRYLQITFTSLVTNRTVQWVIC